MDKYLDSLYLALSNFEGHPWQDNIHPVIFNLILQLMTALEDETLTNNTEV